MSIEAVKAVLRNSKLTLADRLVAIVIAEHTNQKTGSCWPSTETIARMANISRRSVARALKALSDLGYLRWRGTIRPDRKKGTNIYRLDLKKIKADEIKEDEIKELDTMSHGGQIAQTGHNVTRQDYNNWTQCHTVDNLSKKEDNLPTDQDKLSRELDKLSKKSDTVSHITTKEPQKNHNNNHYMNHQSEIENFESNYQENIYSSGIDEADDYDWTLPEKEGEEGGEDLNYDFEHNIKPREVKKTSEPKPIDLSAIGKAIIKDAPKIGLTETEWEESRSSIRRSLDALARQVAKETEEGVEW